MNVNTPTQINLIKINGPKENTFYSNGNFSTNQSTALKLPVTTKINPIENGSNHKTIIQYKQLLNNSNMTGSLKQNQTGLNTIININNGNTNALTSNANN